MDKLCHVYTLHMCTQRHFKPRKPKNSQAGTASNAGEAIERMLVEKRISSKINYDVLKDLADGFSANTTDVASSASAQSRQRTDSTSSLEGSESDDTLLSISRTPPVARGRLPSLSVRKRTFSSLEASPGTSGLEPKFPKLKGASVSKLSSKAALEPTVRRSDTQEADDFLSSVIDLNLKKLTPSNPKDLHVLGEGVEGVEGVVEESGPVQYDDGEEGLDDEELEELAYEDDPLLHSDYEDEGDYYEE